MIPTSSTLAACVISRGYFVTKRAPRLPGESVLGGVRDLIHEVVESDGLIDITMAWGFSSQAHMT